MRYIFLFLAIILISPNLVLGQFSDTNILGNGGATIEITPKNPEPNSTFTATINDYSLTGQTSAINWKVNGEILGENTNQRSITLKTNGSREPILVEATLERNGGLSLVTQREITPYYLDVIVEPQTRTPAFYLGRGLPSKGSTVNLTAILSNNDFPSDLIYTWKINDEVYAGGPLRGRNSISITVPFGEFFSVTTEIKKLDGSLLATKTTQIRSFDPEIYFYEKNSLFGIGNKPITSLNLIGPSATIVAEPFNLDLKTYNNPNLLEWEVDGRKTTTGDGNPYEITLARPQVAANGTSNIDFHVRNLTEILQGAKGKFQIKF